MKRWPDRDQQRFPSLGAYLKNVLHWFTCGYRWRVIEPYGSECKSCGWRLD